LRRPTIEVLPGSVYVSRSSRCRRVSGVAWADRSKTAQRLDVSHVLPKPFTREELLAAVSTAAESA